MAEFSKDPLSFKDGDLIAGRYRITGTLGRGGFGAVYAAQHTMTGQAMAIKVLTIDPDQSEDDVVARFYREARITASLTDIHTVRVFDVGQVGDGPLFMAMEMLRGPTLEKLLRRLREADQTMTELAAIDLALPILQSLQEAHRAELVHRDLKPDNIILAHKGDEDTIVKVLDFGIARTQDSSLTGDGKALGTPAYMSPEQVKGQPLDGRSDLYALALILYRCVTGRLPFVHNDPFALAFMRVSTPPVSVTELVGDAVSSGLNDAIMRGLSAAPEDRFEDAKAMRKALQSLRAGAHVRTPSTPMNVDGAGGSAPIADHLVGLAGLNTLIAGVDDQSLATPSGVRRALAADPSATRIDDAPAPNAAPAAAKATLALAAQADATAALAASGDATQAAAASMNTVHLDTDLAETTFVEPPAETTFVESPAVTTFVESPAVTTVVESPAVTTVVASPAETVLSGAASTRTMDSASSGLRDGAVPEIASSSTTPQPGAASPNRTGRYGAIVAVLLLIGAGLFWGTRSPSAPTPKANHVAPSNKRLAKQPSTAAAPVPREASEPAPAAVTKPSPAQRAERLVNTAMKASNPATRIKGLAEAVQLQPSNAAYKALLATARERLAKAAGGDPKKARAASSHTGAPRHAKQVKPAREPKPASKATPAKETVRARAKNAATTRRNAKPVSKRPAVETKPSVPVIDF